MTNLVKILVVDDIFSNQLLINSILETMGYESKTVSNGKMALEELEIQDYDIIFMDIEMPVMNGIETTKHIREKFPFPKNNTPIVALTAHNMSEFSKKTTEIGFNEIVSKPYSVDKFTTVLKTYLNN